MLIGLGSKFDLEAGMVGWKGAHLSQGRQFLCRIFPSAVRTGCPAELGAAAGWEGDGREGTQA